MVQNFDGETTTWKTEKEVEGQDWRWVELIQDRV
jgi:hypothetical protein